MFAWVLGAAADNPDLAGHGLSTLDRFGQARARGTWSGRCAFAAHTSLDPALDTSNVPHRCTESGRIVTAWARLDNRAELRRILGGQHRTETELIAAAYDRWGATCATHLIGAFTFAVYDPAERELFICRDPLGVRPLYFHCSSDLFVATTAASFLHGLGGLDLQPSSSWLASFVSVLTFDDHATPWDEVHKLEGGHSMMVKLASPMSFTQWRHHGFVDRSEFEATRSDEWVERYRETLCESVRCRLPETGRLGIETTGGLDSSAIIGAAASLWPEQRRGDIHTFGSINWTQEADYTWATSQLHGIANNHDISLTWPLQEEEQLIATRRLSILGYPEDHSAGSFFDPFYQRCRQLGVNTLLSGFGGDECVTNEAGLLLVELARRKRWLTLLRETGGASYKRPIRFMRAVRAAYAGGRGHFAKFGDQTWSMLSVRPGAIEEFDIQGRYNEAYRLTDGYGTVNQAILDSLLGSAHVPARLECASLMAQARSVDYRWPLLDSRLIQQYLDTPSIEKFGNGINRLLHRKAIEGLVPAKVQWKRSKTMGEWLGGLPEYMGLADRVEGVRRELHPALDEIIDIDRLLTTARTYEFTNPHQERTPQTSKTFEHVTAVWSANLFLNTCH